MRFSLKTFLLTTTLFGAGCGLFVHFKNNNPTALFDFLNLCITIFPLGLASATLLWIAWSGSKPKSAKLAIIAVLLVVVPASAYGFLRAFEKPYSIVANEFLIRSKFAGQLENGDVGQELQRRLRSGRLSKSEALTVLETLITRISNVSIRDRAKRGLNLFGWAWPETFIREVHQKYPLKPQFIESILDAYHGPPEVTVEQVAGAGPTEQLVTLKCQYGYGQTPQLERLLSWTPQVYVDGQPAEIVTMPGESPTDPTMRLAKPGEHVVRVDFVSGYSTDMHGGYTVNWKDPPSSWKLGKGHKLRTISVTLKVNVGE